MSSVFPREDHVFTPWLCQPDNLARLARTLGIELEVEATEVTTGIFRTDILARNLADGTRVVIENQFGRSDHDHFGKSLAYMAAHDAKMIVWIAEKFADEHRAALSWLNDNTPDDLGFYCVAPRLLRIAQSPPGLRFDVVVAPNTFVKRKKQEERKIDSAVSDLRESFWSEFGQLVEADDELKSSDLRYGGRLGFQWIMPQVGDVWRDDEPRVLVFVTIPNKGAHGVGLNLHCRDEAQSDTHERIQQAREQTEAQGVVLGRTPADLSTPHSITSTANELLIKSKVAYGALKQAFV